MSIQWTIQKLKVSDLHEYPNNPRRMTEKGIADLTQSIKRFGMAEPIVVNQDLTIIGGHGRKKVLESLGVTEVDCYLPDRALTAKEFDEFNIRLNQNIAGEFDFNILANNFEVADLIEWGFDPEEIGIDLSAPDDKQSEPSPITCPACGHTFTKES
jgi:ParB-like chromosome segregation protein Spo0J